MISAFSMFDTQPYALIIDRDEKNRTRITALLRESGFVVAAFGDSRGALAALAAGPIDIAIVAGQLADGKDALAAARQMRHYRPGTKLLFAGAADALPPDPGADGCRAVTRPFDKRRFLGAVFELLARDSDPAERRDEAELGVMAARLACLRSRQTGVLNCSVAQDVAHQIENAMAARLAGSSEAV